jgi:nucleoside 2-deoxyribosyltransferase
MRKLRDALAVAGVVVTSRWIEGNHEIERDASGEDADRERQRFAEEDLEDINRADVLVIFSPREHFRTGRGGRHVEVGYAIGRGIPIVLVGERENVFHWHSLVTVIALGDDLPAALTESWRRRWHPEAAK